MANSKFHEIPVPIDQASAFAAALRERLGDEVFDRKDAPRLAYRDGSMIVPADWLDAAAAIDVDKLTPEGS